MDAALASKTLFRTAPSRPIVRPQAILWDLDGTLCDGAAAILDAFEHACRERGRNVPPREAVVSRIGMPLRLMFRDLLGVEDRESAALVTSFPVRIRPSWMAWFVLPVWS